MRILVVGAGSIGVYLGTKLFSKGHDVLLLGRKKLKKLHDTIMIGDSFYKLPNKIHSFPKKESFDYIFVTSKLYDLEGNLKSILKNKLEYSHLISIQNGIVEDSLYKPYVKTQSFASISVFEGFRLIENQLVVSHSKMGWKTDNSDVGKDVSEMLVECGINCSIDKNLEIIKAEKTIMNCSVNLLSAIEKKTFFELCIDEKTKRRIDALFDESYTVLDKFYKLTEKEEFRKQFYNIVSSMKHYSSTYQDAIAHKRTESDFLNGLIIRLGKKANIPTPENKKVLEEFTKIYPKH